MNREPSTKTRFPVDARVGMFCCRNCGCVDIQGTAWVEMNSNRLVSDEGPSNDIWCPGCEEHYDGCLMIQESDLVKGGPALYSFSPPTDWTKELIAAAAEAAEYFTADELEDFAKRHYTKSDAYSIRRNQRKKDT